MRVLRRIDDAIAEMPTFRYDVPNLLLELAIIVKLFSVVYLGP